jgi:hypothetical protein
MKTKLFIASLLVLHLGLALFHINHTTMWDDEASVVWFAKNYNQHGKILGYDGTHLFSYRNGQLINNKLGYNNPPLDIYYAAFVIRHFGDSDFTMRLSFALVGFVALIIFVFCLRLITQKDKVWFLFAVSFLVLSINYLLIEANTRYYALNFLFAAISLWATLKMVEVGNENRARRLGLLILQLLSLYMLFLSHYLAAVCWWMMLTFLLWQQGQISFKPKDLFNWLFAGLSSVLFGFMAYYMINQNALNRPDLEGSDAFVLKYSKLIEWLFVDLHRINIIPLWAPLVFVFLFIFKRDYLSPAFKKVMAYSLIFLLLIIALNPQPTSQSNSFDIRYLYVAMPLLYVLIAYLFRMLYAISKATRIMSVILALVFLNSSLLSCIPSDEGPQWLLPNFVKERLRPYPTAYSEALKYINKNFNTRKKILTLPGFHNTVFFRYVPDKIKVTNTLDSNSPLRPQLIDSLGMKCLFIGVCKPDYVFQFGSTETLADYPFKPADFKYIDTIPIYAYGVDVTRPELYWHSFGPRKLKDTLTEALYIFHD